jgi:hypothetical protein
LSKGSAKAVNIKAYIRYRRYKDNPAYAMYNNYIPYFQVQNVNYRAPENILYYNNTEEHLPQYFGNQQSELNNLQKLPSFSFTDSSNVSMFFKTFDWGMINGKNLYKK